MMDTDPNVSQFHDYELRTNEYPRITLCTPHTVTRNNFSFYRRYCCRMSYYYDIRTSYVLAVQCVEDFTVSKIKFKRFPPFILFDNTGLCQIRLQCLQKLFLFSLFFFTNYHVSGTSQTCVVYSKSLGYSGEDTPTSQIRMSFYITRTPSMPISIELSCGHLNLF